MSYLVEEYPAIFKSSAFGVLIVGDDGNLLDYNRKAESILDIPPNQKFSIKDLFPREQSCDKQTFCEGVYHGFNLKNKFISIHYTQVPSENQAYSHYLLITENQDNTLSDEDFETIINTIPGIFYVFTEDGKFIHWNKRFTELSGYSDEEMTYISPIDFFPESYRKEASEAIARVFDTGSASLSSVFLTKDGRAIPHEYFGTKINYLGQICSIGMGIDVTERIEAQNSLKQANKRLSTAQQIAQIGYWEWDWYNQNYLWSDEMYLLCGVPKENGPLQHLDFASRIHRKDLQVLENERKRIVNTLTPGEAEFRFFLPNGEMRYFEVNTSPIIDEKGSFASLEGTIQDITERKAQEAAVSSSNERYELISKATNDAVWDWDISTNEITGNANYLELFGLNRDSIIDEETYFTRIHPDDKERVRANMAEALFSHQKTIIDEYRFKNRKGKYRIILDRSQVFYDDKGMPKRMVGAMQDITSQKKAEEELLNITNRLSLATTSAKLGVFDWNTQKDVLEWNEYMYEIFDVDPSDFDRSFQSWLDCLHPKDLHQFDLISNQELLKRRLLHTHVRVVPFSEEIKYVEIHAILLPDKEGKVYSVIGVCRDISEKVLAEQSINRAIISTQESERFEIGRELHDNAIQVLIAALMNLNHIKEKSNDPATITSIELTKKAINEIRRLSHQLAPSDLGNLAIEDSIRDLLKEMNINNEFLIDYEVDIEPDTWLPDEMKINLYRIVQEQLNNIHKHSKATEIKIELTIKGQKLVLRTRDNGVGFQANANFRGIGINNMERRVKMFEGDIEINSSPNNGCEIIIQIPIDNTDY
ncbi:MAG: hypothetical protein CMP48_24900 [Rickettsiales bacterium]|nr:hypothetical protein [Rickettsiales bacterium]